MCWQKSCACCRNWKSSLHGSRWLILIKLLKIIRCRLPELSIYKGRLKSKKQTAKPVFLAEPLTRTTTSSSLPWERVRERATSRKACIWAVRCWERLPQFGEYPLPNPPPRGRERIAAGFTVAGGLKSNLDLQPLTLGRLKNKKAACTTCFPCRTINPNSSPSSLPWERARERAASRKACIGAVRVLGKIAAIGRMPSPQPSPTGEGAGCSRFCEFWRFERQLGFAAIDFRSSEK